VIKKRCVKGGGVEFEMNNRSSTDGHVTVVEMPRSLIWIFAANDKKVPQFTIRRPLKFLTRELQISKFKMKLPLRIAILECDTPLEKTKAKYGGYGGVFKQLLERGADKLGHPGLSSKEGMGLKMFNVENDPEVYPKLEDIDAIVITGSRKISHLPSKLFAYQIPRSRFFWRCSMDQYTRRLR
jgi:hypothetical protein